MTKEKSKVTGKYPKALYQFWALREAWKKSASPMKDDMIKMLTESMNEVIEVYKLEQDALKDLKNWKE